MQCPLCNLPLKKGDRAGVALLFCERCGGAWLDLFHLDLILYRTKPKAKVDEEHSDLEVSSGAEARRR
jgi:Zn-finger nucleic acid-binding protein